MNRKNINKIIGLFVPATSEVLGSPRRTAKLVEYAGIKKENISLTNLNDKLNTESPAITDDFFDKNEDSGLDYYIVKLKAARIWGRNGAVIAEGDYFISDVSREFNRGMNIEHSVFYTIRQSPVSLYNGVVALINTAGADIYYHWMIDVLPRIGLIKMKYDLDTIDHFVTGYSNLSFQLETLQRHNIPTGKLVINTKANDFHVKANELILPSLAGVLDMPNAYQVNYLRELYKDSIVPQTGKRVYISRKLAGTRMILNEDELTGYLSEQGFEIIVQLPESVAAQARLFSACSFIISSHGSALTNIAFCNTGTKVIDLFNEHHHNPCFWYIAKINSLPYKYFMGESVAQDSNYKNNNTRLDMSAFADFFEQFDRHFSA